MLVTDRHWSRFLTPTPLGVLAFLFSSLAISADDAKDPNGWGELRFGMRPADVMKQLGQKVQVREVRIARPLMLDDQETPDLQSALTLSRTLLENQEDVRNAEKRKAAEVLLDLIKPRTWKGSNPPDLAGKAGARLTISGTLEEFGGKKYVHDFIKVRPRNNRLGPATLLKSSLDAKSAEHVALVNQSIYDLSEILLAEQRDAVNAAPVDLDRIRIEPIRIRGITLIPSVRFANDELIAVRLSTPGADNPTTPRNPNWHGMYVTLCEALAEKYGAPDERGRGESADFTKWRFPQTEISCTSHRFGLGITYRRREPDAKTDDESL